VTKKELLSLDYHRNGVGGLPFWVALVKETEDGEERIMLVIRNKEADKDTGAVVCFALDVKKLTEGDIRFYHNSWRGDHYAEFMDTEIKRK
jgi:hypothetical protein